MSGAWVRNPAIVWREEPAERAAILDALERGEESADRGWVILVDGAQMHELNLMAGEIWCLADGTRDEEDMVVELARRYEAPLEEIRADVRAFVGQCSAKGWVLRAGGDAPEET